MAKWGITIDISRCTGCYNCFTACKDEYWDNDFPPYSVGTPRYGQNWIDLKKVERGPYNCLKVAYIPVLCMGCEEAPCIKAAKDGAIYRRPDSIVIIDPEKAKGQEQIVKACPYGVIFWNEEKKLPQKCTWCAHRIDAGQVPKCVMVCPSECLKFGNLDDPNSEVSKLVASGKVEVLEPKLNTKPVVYYKDYPKTFIAGSVVYGDKNDCAEGANVTLTDKAGGKKTEVKANFFGDFVFDGLDTGKYEVKIEASGYESKAMDIDLKTDNYLGAILLAKK